MLDDLNLLISNILSQAQKSGIDAAEVNVSKQNGTSVTVRKEEVDTILFHQDKQLSITVYKGGKKGSASTTDLSEQSIKNTLRAATQIAEFTEEDPFAGLLEREYLATQQVDCDLYHPVDIPMTDAIDRAKRCEAAASQFDERIVNSEGATWTDLSTFQAYGNTNGFIGAYPSTRYSLSCSMVAKSERSMERDYDYSVARTLYDLRSEEDVGKTTAQKALMRLHPRKIKTQQIPVMFSRELASGLFGHFIAAISGGVLYRGASFLCNQLGKKIFPDFFQCNEQPHIPKGLASAPFDGEGAATKERAVVHDGILESYVLSGYSARKLGMQTTGNAGGIHNMLIHSTGQTFEELLKSFDRGFLVTELIGQGVNLVNGDYSRGAFGYWIESGQIQYPVHEVTVAGNLKDMYASIQAIGTDTDKRSSILSGSVWLDKMMVGGS